MEMAKKQGPKKIGTGSIRANKEVIDLVWRKF